MSGPGSELARKLLHVAFGACAFALRWLTAWQALLLALAALAFNRFILHRLTGRALLRAGERGRGCSSGIVLYPAMVAFGILVFHRRLELAAATWALIGFGDGMAAIAGRWLGGPRLAWNPGKRWAGSLTFVLYGTAFAALSIPWTQRAAIDATAAAEWVGLSFWGAGRAGPDGAFLLAGCLAAALAAAWAESLDVGIDDNLSVALVGGSTLFLATLVEPRRLVDFAGIAAERLPWAGGVCLLLALLAWVARGASRRGALAGWVVATSLAVLGGWPALLVLMMFVALGTLATRIGYSRKAALGIAQSAGGRRGPAQALANTATALCLAFLAVATPHSSLFTLGMVAALATATCDTLSSEIGQTLGRGHYMITNLRRVTPGTDGAISLVGTVSGVLGAALLALVAWRLDLVSVAALPIVVLAALVGGTVDSYLGATLQRSGRIGNELINLLNTVAGAATACALYALVG